MDNMTRIDDLAKAGTLPKRELVELLSSYSEADRIYAAEKAKETSLSVFGKKIFSRGLVEISNYCRNDCYYCGIRRSNTKAVRYRLSLNEIYYCCDWGYEAGFRTFVLQGGEDSLFKENLLARIIRSIKEK